MTRSSITWPTWFDLRRHDGDEGGTDDGQKPDQHDDATDGDAGQSDGAKPKSGDLGDAGKAALAKERAARRAAEKDAAEKAARLKEIEDRDKTDAEKLAAKAKEAEETAVKAVGRAVRAEVRALADGFADREDAVLMLGDLSQFVTGSDIDTEAIEAALTDLLQRKPHLARPAPKLAEQSGPKRPAPDASQGRGGDTTPPDFTKATPEVFATELAKYGLRPYGQ